MSMPKLNAPAEIHWRRSNMKTRDPILMKSDEVLKDCRSLNAAAEMKCPMPRSVEKVPVRNEKRCTGLQSPSPIYYLKKMNIVTKCTPILYLTTISYPTSEWNQLWNRFHCREWNLTWNQFCSGSPRNRNQIRLAKCCWNRNRNQFQSFEMESESIPVDWNRAGVCIGVSNHYE